MFTKGEEMNKGNFAHPFEIESINRAESIVLASIVRNSYEAMQQTLMTTPAKQSCQGKNENESDVVESLLKLNSEEISRLPIIDEKKELSRKDFTKEI